MRLAGTIGVGLCAFGASGGCAHAPSTTIQATPAVVTQPAEDAAARLIAEADRHLDAGLTEAKDGHLNRAREEWDRAIDVYLTAPGGAYANERLGEAYRRSLNTILQRELEALAAGDGYTETPTEPASIDDVGDFAVTDMAPSEEVRRTAEEAVKGETNDLPIELNNAVLSCIELYRGRLRDWFTTALARGGRYLPQIREVFASEGVPQDLAYVALVESAFKTGALSRAKAKGVWQFIAATGRRYGLQQDWWVDERSDPEKATRAAARYLKELHELFGDWNLALAGYNAGEGKVQRGISRYGTRDFWSLAKTRALRRETKNYVPLIHAAIVVAKAPAQYGFDVVPEPILAYDTVSVAGAVDLRLISECAESSLDQLQLLNPQLRRLATPANRAFEVRVPPGTSDATRRCIEAIPPDKRVRFRTHVVARGQTMSTIAKQYGARTTDIAEANGLSLRRNLSAGTELIIPTDPRAKNVPARSAPAPAERTAAGLRSSGTAVRISYRIKPGDTLAAIAVYYRTTIRDLQSWNGLRSTRIAAGGVLTIYTSRKF